MKNNKNYTPEMKAQAILEVLEDKKMIKEIVNEYEIIYSTLRSWKNEVVNRMSELVGRKLEADI
ncbi:transposase [Sedimentibacter sp. zth1]|uniref:transposase n=1 Tax=Sedimentibacter sp. zth1 TaxID=2816908 RepID=UPI001A93A057|nr:transposase [Sedimentibacter sp. zth1]QSX05288.1 transposase [Sedimentibacter sp. zth1]